MKKYIFLMSKNESRFVDVMVWGNKQEIKIEKYCKKVNVSVIGSLIFFSYSEIFIKVNITKLKNPCKHKSKES